MAFNKPSLVDVTSFDASEDQRVYFNVTGGDLHTKALIIVTERYTPYIIYKQFTVDCESDFFIIPANTLENNKYYAMTLQVGDGTNWSEKSQSDYFSCFSKPAISINDVSTDGSTVITSRIYTFTGTYTQNDDPIRYYRYRVYTQDGQLFFDSGNVYDTMVSAQVAGFANETNYSVVLEVLSQSGIGNSTGRIPVRVKYAKSGIESQMDVVCDPMSGDVSIRAIIKDQEGTLYDYADGLLYETEDDPQFVTYKDNDGVNSRWVQVPADQAILFATDDYFVEGFALQIWFTRQELTKTVEIAKIYCGTDTILFAIGPTMIEALCAFNGRETIYGLPIQQITTPCNETLRVTIENSALNMEYLKGGVIE